LTARDAAAKNLPGGRSSDEENRAYAIPDRASAREEPDQRGLAPADRDRGARLQDDQHAGEQGGRSPPRRWTCRTRSRGSTRGEYLLLFDPLDGSSNIDVNIAVGTIFSVLRCPPGVSGSDERAFLQPGTSQVAAGAATDGKTRILELQPHKLHQRAGVILGSKNEVERVTSYHAA